MKDIKTIQFKRFIREYEFLQEDLNDLKDIQSVVNTEFTVAFSSMKDAIDQDDIRLERLAKNAKQAKIDLDDEKPEEERDPIFKNLFRKIVVTCHPDKVKGDTVYVSLKRELYESAIKANEDYDWAALIILAGKAEIPLGPEYTEKLEEVQKSAAKLAETINNIKGTIAWQWYHASEDLKPTILESYRDHLLKMMNNNQEPETES
jgi:hypothetical protein